jgi:hypothetical protein
MEIKEALQKAEQILDEEYQRPTVGYKDVSLELAVQSTAKPLTRDQIIFVARMKHLSELRLESPRSVAEMPMFYTFGGTNFDLMLKLFGTVNTNEREVFIAHILERVKMGLVANPGAWKYEFPKFDNYVSDTPLIAEFCIRTNNKNAFFKAIAEIEIPSYAAAIMLTQLEETIALNFNVFSDEELANIPKWLKSLHQVAERQTYSARGNGQMVKNPHYRPGRERQSNRILGAIDGIERQCQQARYWYLKGALQQTVNLEVESDKAKVESFLTSLGFSPEMEKALTAAENDYKSMADPFELKSCLGHLRTFLEHLHRDAAVSIAATLGEPLADKWGEATVFLRKQGFLTKREEEFSTALFTLISDGAVHALVAQREQARLLRNVVIEYGVMFLSVLDKKGVKITAKVAA